VTDRERWQLVALLVGIGLGFGLAVVWTLW
jgi:hypothetical protein